MIDPREIREAARALSLSPQVVEKDYVLGWVLAGIATREAIARTWVFKGGTCLKKCYFETYRFSEDLDFTVIEAGQLDEEFLREELTAAAAWVYDVSGVDLLPDQLRFEVYRNQRGGLSCEGRVYYRGPIAPRGDPPRIKLDLTADEQVVREPVIREVHHPYSDSPDGGIQTLCYCFEELFAEKIRALGERCRPRDLYDVVHLYRRPEVGILPSEVSEVLDAKCRYKGVAVPTMDVLERRRAELDAEWSNMLSHQLQALPDVGDFWDELPEIFAWIVQPTLRRVVPPPIAAAQAGTSIPRVGLQGMSPASAPGAPAIQSIYFAGANRLCVDLRYQGKVRRIEPYSLRRTRDGNILLYACHASDGAVRAYRVDRIEGAEVTSQPFRPRFAVELTERGPVSISPTATGSRTSGGSWLPVGRRPRGGGGPTYVVQCPVCGRRFKRKTRSTSLRRHNDKGGWPCSGRRGVIVDSTW